jgi:hypothetical protein
MHRSSTGYPATSPLWKLLSFPKEIGSLRCWLENRVEFLVRAAWKSGSLGMSSRHKTVFFASLMLTKAFHVLKRS